MRRDPNRDFCPESRSAQVKCTWLSNESGEGAKVQAALFTFMDFCAIMELLDRLEFDEVLE